MFSFRKEAISFFILVAASLLVYSRGLNIHGIEYRDDEIFYYKSTQEMVATGDYLSPKYFGEDRFQKPILYYWLITLSYKLFGVGWTGARFVAVLFAGLSVGVTWLLGQRLFGPRVAHLSAVILMTVPLFFRHAKNAVPDMVLNFFIVLALYYAVRVIQAVPPDAARGQTRGPGSSKDSLLFFTACAVGFMVKGFAALIVPFLTVIVYGLMARDRKILSEFQFGRGMVVVLLIVCPWFLYMFGAHGHEYLNYMLIDETKNRLITGGSGNFFLKQAGNFLDHIAFYSGVIGSYFAPWCVFLIGGIPLAFAKIKAGDRAREGLRIILTWFFVVFLFFSTMYFSINHYMLVLTTPFALLVSIFLLEGFRKEYAFGRAVAFFRKFALIALFTVCSIAFGFLFVFMSDAGKWWLAVFLPAYLVIVQIMARSKDTMTPAMIMGIFLAFAFSQSALLDRAGITTHAALQKFAGVIHQQIQDRATQDAVIGVGSHDIHEKEFQVYFDQRVEKAAGSMPDETMARLRSLFSTKNELYCLITDVDFHRFIEGAFPGKIEVLQEDYIIRKRFNIDSGFFVAIMKLDQQTVHDYMKEKLVLIRKKPDA